MIKLGLHFNENEGGPEVLKKEIVIDLESNELEEFIANQILHDIGRRSLAPFRFDKKKLYLTYIEDQNGETLFWNAHNL